MLGGLRDLGGRLVDGAQQRTAEHRSALQSGLQTRLQTAQAGLQTAQDAIQQRRAQAYEVVGGKLSQYMKDRAHLDYDALAGAGFGMPAVGPRWAAAKLNAQKVMFDMGAPARAKVMFALKEATKGAATADPDMCQCIRSRIDDIIDVFWNDLTTFTEQMYEDQRNLTLGKAAGTVDELGGMGEVPTTCGPKWWRALILYHFLPYDLSLFGCFKDPIWWVLTLISIVPLYGIRVAFFALILILIILGHPPDEYQLVSYILGFKGSQFFSSGVIQAIVAAVKYYMCVHPGGTHTCDVDGPGANQDLVTGLVDFVGSCALTWLAFLWLPRSVRSAGLREVVEVDPTADPTNNELAPKTCCGGVNDPEKGGRLRGLLGWDVWCFVVSCGLLALLVYIDASHMRPGGKPTTPADFGQMWEDTNTWEGHTAIFWARVFYAFLSFPFVIFLIPGLNSILTHTTATGYNRQGFCVPFMLHPMPEEKVK